MQKLSDELPDPLDMNPSEAFDCLFRLRAATEDVCDILSGQPELQEAVRQRLYAAWRGNSPYRDT